VDDKGENNKIMELIIPFKKELEGITRLPVIYEKEYMSSQHAEFFQGKHDMLDASAAALILQRYLDKHDHIR
jgi:RNase H-fold protein (predicted Holliday junction resolvase)